MAGEQQQAAETVCEGQNVHKWGRQSPGSQGSGGYGVEPCVETEQEGSARTVYMRS